MTSNKSNGVPAKSREDVQQPADGLSADHKGRACHGVVVLCARAMQCAPPQLTSGSIFGLGDVTAQRLDFGRNGQPGTRFSDVYDSARTARFMVRCACVCSRVIARVCVPLLPSLGGRLFRSSAVCSRLVQLSGTTYSGCHHWPSRQKGRQTHARTPAPFMRIVRCERAGPCRSNCRHGDHQRYHFPVGGSAHPSRALARCTWPGRACL